MVLDGYLLCGRGSLLMIFGGVAIQVEDWLAGLKPAAGRIARPTMVVRI
jgi:hypothetical protein